MKIWKLVDPNLDHLVRGGMAYTSDGNGIGDGDLGYGLNKGGGSEQIYDLGYGVPYVYDVYTFRRPVVHEVTG